MARSSLPNAARLIFASALSETAASLAGAAERSSWSFCRRGYAVSSAVARVKPVEDKVREKSIEGLVDSSSSSWVPDPVTGYYRPADRTGEVDPAELRNLLLTNRSHH